MCLLLRDGFGGGVGGLRLSSFVAATAILVITKFFASTYSYDVLIILVVVTWPEPLVLVLRVIVPVGLKAVPLNENDDGFQSRLQLRLLKSVESRVLAGSGGGRKSSSDVESVVSTELRLLLSAPDKE